MDENNEARIAELEGKVITIHEQIEEQEKLLQLIKRKMISMKFM